MIAAYPISRQLAGVQQRCRCEENVGECVHFGLPGQPAFSQIAAQNLLILILLLRVFSPPRAILGSQPGIAGVFRFEFEMFEMPGTRMFGVEGAFSGTRTLSTLSARAHELASSRGRSSLWAAPWVASMEIATEK